MPEKLPPNASEWIEQRKQAAPNLQAIRDEELRRRGDAAKVKAAECREVTGTRIYEKFPERHGMVIMQHWWMRRYLLESLAKDSSGRGESNGQ